VISNDQGQICLVKPKSRPLLELPGGGMEIEENMQEALIREVLEETGYNIVILGETPMYVAENFFYVDKHSKYYHMFYFVYPCMLSENSS
jgi:8-oxo-dGTP diphosphatase